MHFEKGVHPPEIDEGRPGIDVGERLVKRKVPKCAGDQHALQDMRTQSGLARVADTWEMLPLLFVALLAIPIAELWVILQVADGIGVLNTIALLILISVAGAWLLKQQGLATWARLQRTLAAGQMPAREVTDGALILFGGALLLTPGFLTDCVGLILLIPPTRALVKGLFRRLLARWAERRFVPPGGRRAYDATVVRSRRRSRATADRSNPLNPGDGPPGVADSPDRE
jgi:UPF0716 protein FxsA